MPALVPGENELAVGRVVDGEDKEPVTDLEKISKHGRLALTRNSTGELTTLENVGEHGVQNDLLEVVFENGDVVREHDLDAIRERAHLGPGQAGANVFR